MSSLDRETEELVWCRAGSRCEYCQFPSEFAEASFQIDHIIARKHGGDDAPNNLALACYSCNTYKGPNIASLDPLRGRLVRLYHPRRDRWAVHFQWDGPILAALTPVGRVTIQTLWINHPAVIDVRTLLMAEGLFHMH